MTPTSTETTDVRDIIEAWAAGVRARDIDAVLRAHSNDLLMFDVVGPMRLEGLEEYKRTWLEQFFPWHGGTGRFDLRDLRVTAGESVAFATAFLDCAGTEDGQRVAFTLRLTVGLEKRGDRWTVTHEHHSQPIDFDTDRIGPGESSSSG
jgi:ketosteroid isomerase-like protein